MKRKRRGESLLTGALSDEFSFIRLSVLSWPVNAGKMRKNWKFRLSKKKSRKYRRQTPRYRGARNLTKKHCCNQVLKKTRVKTMVRRQSSKVRCLVFWLQVWNVFKKLTWYFSVVNGMCCLRSVPFWTIVPFWSSCRDEAHARKDARTGAPTLEERVKTIRAWCCGCKWTSCKGASWCWHCSIKGVSPENNNHWQWSLPLNGDQVWKTASAALSETKRRKDHLQGQSKSNKKTYSLCVDSSQSRRLSGLLLAQKPNPRSRLATTRPQWTSFAAWTQRSNHNRVWRVRRVFLPKTVNCISQRASTRPKDKSRNGKFLEDLRLDKYVSDGICCAKQKYFFAQLLVKFWSDAFPPFRQTTKADRCWHQHVVWTTQQWRTKFSSRHKATVASVDTEIWRRRGDADICCAVWRQWRQWLGRTWRCGQFTSWINLRLFTPKICQQVQVTQTKTPVIIIIEGNSNKKLFHYWRNWQGIATYACSISGERASSLSNSGKEIQSIIKRGQRDRVAHTPNLPPKTSELSSEYPAPLGQFIEPNRMTVSVCLHCSMKKMLFASHFGFLCTVYATRCWLGSFFSTRNDKLLQRNERRHFAMEVLRSPAHPLHLQGPVRPERKLLGLVAPPRNRSRNTTSHLSQTSGSCEYRLFFK